MNKGRYVSNNKSVPHARFQVHAPKHDILELFYRKAEVAFKKKNTSVFL